MNDVIQCLKERRSIRKFKKDMPSKEVINEIIEAGLYAPSGMGKQSAIVIAVTDQKIRDQLSAMNCKIGGWKEGFDPFYGAPVILIVLANKNERNHVYDGSLMMGNMLNATHALGLGGIWINRAKEEFETEEGKKILAKLGISGEWEGIGHCAIGYAEGPLPAAAPRKEGRVFWIE